MRINGKTTHGEALALLSAVPMGGAEFDAFVSRFAACPLPPGLRVNYDALTFGQLWGCFRATSTVKAIREVTGLTDEAVLALPAPVALAFTRRHVTELERIGKLFEKVAYRPTPDEVAAGINAHPAGMHGIADWYARRMGISDVSLVEAIPWARVYNAMEMDYHDHAFRRKLARIESDRLKWKQR